MHAFVTVAGRFGIFGSAAPDRSLRTLHSSPSCFLHFASVADVTHVDREVNSSLHSTFRQLHICAGR